MHLQEITQASDFEKALPQLSWQTIQEAIASAREDYETVVGLEVHAQLKTASKAFASEETTYGQMPNTNISVVTLAHPGVLPRVNKKVFNYALRLGLACESEITRENVFARKNYFYPDLPKGYQITQDKTPICVGGKVYIQPKGATEEKAIRLVRIHLEEDAGKSMHIEGERDSFIDLNRAGVPLIEIVSEPDIRQVEEAYAYLTEIRKLVRYLDICDGNMEEGSLRCDVNVSIRKKGVETFGTRVEVKNLNSFSNVKRAMVFEFERQLYYALRGWTFIQETRTFDAPAGKTYALRSKESMNDYRYFPEPDLTPVIVDEHWIAQVQEKMPPLPRELYLKFTKEYSLSPYDAEVLTAEKETALYFEEVCQFTKNYKAAANWVSVNVKGYLNELMLTIDDFPIVPEKIAALINLIDAGKINHNIASKKVYPALLATPNKTALQIVQEENLLLEDNTEELQTLIQTTLAQFPDKVAAYRGGKKGLQGMFMGEIMKKTKGKADAKLVSKMLQEALNQSE
ncbi:MAG: Asp-tRNA(Asn)/Glu-tRNA(Gln) amidotransferase subunit GatB [Thermonemataceae bacterium]